MHVLAAFLPPPRIELEDCPTVAEAVENIRRAPGQRAAAIRQLGQVLPHQTPEVAERLRAIRQALELEADQAAELGELEADTQERSP